jgi:histidinol dehydrogenase
MMNIIEYPPRESWERLCIRPVMGISNLDIPVRTILGRVKKEGDKAIRDYSRLFDRVALVDIKVQKAEIDGSYSLVPDDLKRAIDIAKSNIEKFHKSQIVIEEPVETMPGVKCWRKSVPVEKVGLYIPGGTAPLFSTALMLAIPALIAGCKQIVMCSPPNINGKVNPVILYSASLIGVTDIYKIGGAQAIAAMAYGTETVPRVFKIFGPGNQYVTKAKEIVQSEGVAIDMPAGPSEVLVVADSEADPQFIASDLLAQAEHGPDSQVVLVTDSEELLVNVRTEIEKMLAELPRKNIAARALENSLFLLFSSLEECMEFSNMYAPEHLIINTLNATSLVETVINAGSVFIGKYSCESAGDYASGTNHTLPTNGSARSFSGVSTDSFTKQITFQELSSEGIKNIGPAIEAMAEAELLHGHKTAVSLRLNKLKDV